MKLTVFIQFILYYLIGKAVAVKSNDIGPTFYGTDHGNTTAAVPRREYEFEKSIFERYSRSSTDLPTMFTAPDISSQNFWNADPKNYESAFPSNFNYPKPYSPVFSPTLNGFSKSMTSLLDQKRQMMSRQPFSSTHSQTTEYRHPVQIHLYSNTASKFLPPAIPIGASVVKLETATPKPERQIVFQDSSQRYRHQHFITKHKTEHSDDIHIEELGFHTNSNIKNSMPNLMLHEIFTDFFKKLKPTTLYSGNGYNINFNYKSLQSDVEKEACDPQMIVLFASAKESPILKSEIENDGTLITQKGRENVIAISTNSTKEKDRKKLTSGTLNYTEGTKKLIEDESGAVDTRYIPTSTTFKARNQFDKIRNQSNSNGGEGEVLRLVNEVKPGDHNPNHIEIITDMTLRGLSKSKKQQSNIHEFMNIFNMSSVITYELEKLKERKQPKSKDNLNETSNEFLSEGNEELSLDLKILKDTNWDGFTTKQAVLAPLTENRSFIKHKQDVAENNYNNDFKNISFDNKYILPSAGKAPHDNYSKPLENQEIKSKTLIVETRVTKSISQSKLSPRNEPINLRHMGYRKKFKVQNTNGVPTEKLRAHIQENGNNTVINDSKRGDIISEEENHNSTVSVSRIVHESYNKTTFENEEIPYRYNATTKNRSTHHHRAQIRRKHKRPNKSNNHPKISRNSMLFITTTERLTAQKEECKRIFAKYNNEKNNAAELENTNSQNPESKTDGHLKILTKLIADGMSHTNSKTRKTNRRRGGRRYKNPF